MKIEFFELIFAEFLKRSLEGNYPLLVPRRADSVNFLILGLVIGHSLLHGGPGFYVFQGWVYESISGRTDPEHLMILINKDLIPKHAGSANLLKLIDALDSTKSQEDLDNTTDEHMEIINCSRWDPTKRITLENKGVLLAELLFDELIRKRQSQIQSIREGMQAVGLLPYINSNAEICKQVFVAQATINRQSFSELIVNDDVRRDEFENKQAYEYFQSFLDSASTDTLSAILKFTTGFQSIPPWGLRKHIVIRYLEDDEKKIYPEAMACFNILQLPTVHSKKKTFEEHILKALSIEGIGFSASS